MKFYAFLTALDVFSGVVAVQMEDVTIKDTLTKVPVGEECNSLAEPAINFGCVRGYRCMKPQAKKDGEKEYTEDAIELCDKEDKCGKETTYTIPSGMKKEGEAVKVIWVCAATKIHMAAASLLVALTISSAM